MSIAKQRLAGAALGVIALVLAACGGDDDPTTETDPGAGDVDATVAIGDGGDLGDILVDGDGNTLYIAEGESGDTILCTAGCLSTWPPLTVPDGESPTAGSGVDGSVSTVTRDDGTLQVTYDDLPLYTFASDSGPGDTSGHGVSDQLTWHAVTPDGPAPLGDDEDSGSGPYG